jgi:hypothetical protein
MRFVINLAIFANIIRRVYPVLHSFPIGFVCVACGDLHSFSENLHAIFMPGLCNPVLFRRESMTDSK